MTASERPIIVITMGDAAGVGPEIVVKALLSEGIFAICRPLVVGSSLIMRETMKSVGGSLKLRPVNAAAEVEGESGTVDIIDLHNLEPRDVVAGKISATCGKAAMEYIAEAARLALGGEVGALVTAPINKEATRKAGYGELGHLDFLARLTGTAECATMLVAGRLRVVHLTTHHSLKQACDFVTRERVLARLKLTHDSLEKWGIERPRIAVAALNPHAGEGGLLGSEEIEEIGPAIRMAQDSGVDARGPFPADSVFSRALRGEFDAVLAMYHDQGHIPVKVYSFEKTVSVALGLPFVRTSVDHGTAFDIAGRGIANPQSLIEAIRMAVSLSRENKLPEVSD
ncbi:MAG: 4-hydroxythreonine-4-phosphate dehydrogenase PdxA [Chloroflexi bacterium RBG_13_54_9]|nr:MAG: 4-hydroxythreonine-4-phosphate dehydrogenase PdxA [Chloroflexi bacterium RBG_13_54_9]